MPNTDLESTIVALLAKSNAEVARQIAQTFRDLIDQLLTGSSRAPVAAKAPSAKPGKAKATTKARTAAKASAPVAAPAPVAAAPKAAAPKVAAPKSKANGAAPSVKAPGKPAKAASKPAKAASKPAKAAKSSGRRDSATVTADNTRLLEFIAANAGLRSEEIQKRLGMPKANVASGLVTLREDGKIRMTGAKRAATYAIA